ncbi:MAG: TonB-dependent receptor [Brumimicrobium sp.]|nr:TonB-dependent receptor [Brumimicrobium sp.]
MRAIKFFKTLILVGLVLPSFAQEGFIRGSVLEEATGEYLPGVKVMVENHKNGAYTDIDGKFSITVEPGIYNLQITFMEFDTIRIKDVEVKPKETVILDDIKMSEDVSNFDEVVITAEMITNTENAILSLKQKSSNMIDGISSANFRKIGDSDAGAAMKRVPGVSLNGGKYIFVRGLGDRYSKTLLNGLDVPGLDPDRNTVQMDIFPTNIIDNIVVHKSFSAELPADFSGGLVDLSLQNFPDHRVRRFSFSTAYNPNYHFNPNYVTAEGGATDFLGFDDGTRDIPAENNIPFFTEAVSDPNGPEARRYQEILSKFNPNLAAMRQQSFMDFGFGASVGDQFKKTGYSIGYNVSLSYKNSTEYYEDAIFGRYGLSGDKGVYKMDQREYQIGDFGVNNVMSSLMGGIAFKTGKSKYTLNILHLQNGESKAGIFDYSSTDQGAEFSGFQHNIEYSERSLTNAILTGRNDFRDKNWTLDWRISSSLSKIEDPDIRFTRYEVRHDGNYSISTESGFPERIWRELNEINVSGKADATKELNIFGQKGSIKFGGIHTYKQRDFNIQNFAINVRNIPLTGDPNELFAPENLWPYNGSIASGTTFEAPFIPVNPNTFSASVNNSGAYFSSEITPVNRLKMILGVRTEYYTQRYTGQDQLGTNVLVDDIVLQDLGIFPTLNMVYAVTDKQNLRLSYGKTIARPSFKELSYAEIVDPITGRTFIGGLFRDADDAAGIEYWDGNLVSTDIHNFDVRWEMFHGRGQTVSISGFYKYFINPIEIIQFASQAGSFQPRNVGDGQVVGGEIEVRQSFSVISKKLENFALTFNYTITQSRIELSTTEYQSRLNNAREGQEVGRYRDMAGQAPMIFNGGLSFDGTDAGFFKSFEAGVFYNVQGETLQFAGIVDRPDIYTVPFHSLNFNMNKKFGKNENMSAGFKVANILNDKREAVFKSYGAEDEYFSSLGIGTTFSLNFSINF